MMLFAASKIVLLPATQNGINWDTKGIQESGMDRDHHTPPNATGPAAKTPNVRQHACCATVLLQHGCKATPTLRVSGRKSISNTPTANMHLLCSTLVRIEGCCNRPHRSGVLDGTFFLLPRHQKKHNITRPAYSPLRQTLHSCPNGQCSVGRSHGGARASTDPATPTKSRPWSGGLTQCCAS